MHIKSIFFIVCWLVSLALPLMAVTDNRSVAVRANITSVCQLILNYTPNQVNFSVPNSKLTGLQRGNPLSYATVEPDDPSGVQVVVKSNSPSGVKLDIAAAGNFTNPANGKTIPIQQLTWSSAQGGKNDIPMTLTDNTCFTTGDEGIVTETITYKLKVFTLNASGDYQGVILYTATNL